MLFALNNFTPYGFGQTWPVLLIVFGLLSLLARGSEPPVPPRTSAAWNRRRRTAAAGSRVGRYRGQLLRPARLRRGGAAQRPPEPGPTNEPGECT